MAGRVFLAVFLCLAAIMEDQIKVEGWELEALEESLDCYKPTREIRGVCGVRTVTAVSRSAQKGEMIIYTRNGKVKAKCPEYRFGCPVNRTFERANPTLLKKLFM